MARNKESMYVTGTLTGEQEVILRLANGDEETFYGLYATYKNRLLHFVLKFVKSHELTEGIFQDTFTVVWQTHRFINPEASFPPYLYTIVRSRILNRLWDVANEDQLKEQILPQAIDSASKANSHILFDSLKETIARVLEQLAPRQREVFKMNRKLQISHKEVTKTLGVSVHTVQGYISLSLKAVCSYLIRYSSMPVDVLLVPLYLNL